MRRAALLLLLVACRDHAAPPPAPAKKAAASKAAAPDAGPTITDEASLRKVLPMRPDGRATVRLPDSGAAMVAAIWGDPVIGKAFLAEGKLEERAAWFEPSAGTRAWIAGQDLVIEPYTPGEDVLRFLIGARPLLGKPVADADALLEPVIDARTGRLDLPPAEWDARGVSALSLELREGFVMTVRAQLFYGNAARRDELLKQLGTSWGTARPVDDGVSYGTGPYVWVRDYEPDTQLSIVLTTIDPALY